MHYKLCVSYYYNTYQNSSTSSSFSQNLLTCICRVDEKWRSMYMQLWIWRIKVPAKILRFAYAFALAWSSFGIRDREWKELHTSQLRASIIIAQVQTCTNKYKGVPP